VQNQPPTSSQPGHPSVGRHNEYWVVNSSDVNKANSVKAKAKARQYKAKARGLQGQGQGLTLQRIKSRS